MKTQHKSNISASVWESAKALHASRIINKKDLKKFEVLCLEPEEISDEVEKLKKK